MLRGERGAATVGACSCFRLQPIGGGPSDLGGHEFVCIQAASEHRAAFLIFRARLCGSPEAAPSQKGIPMQLTRYRTSGGVTVQREVWLGPYEREHDTLARILDSRRGVLFSSSFEFPGRYTRLDMGFVDPPLVLTARDRSFSVEALNARGHILLEAIEAALSALAVAEIRRTGEDRIDGEVRQSDSRF